MEWERVEETPSSRSDWVCPLILLVNANLFIRGEVKKKTLILVFF